MPKYHLLTLLVADSSHTVGWHGEWQRAALPRESSEHPQHAPKFTFRGKVTARCWSGAAGVSNDPGASDAPGESSCDDMGIASDDGGEVVAFLGAVQKRGFSFTSVLVRCPRSLSQIHVLHV